MERSSKSTHNLASIEVNGNFVFGFEGRKEDLAHMLFFESSFILSGQPSQFLGMDTLNCVGAVEQRVDSPC